MYPFLILLYYIHIYFFKEAIQNYLFFILIHIHLVLLYCIIIVIIKILLFVKVFTIITTGKIDYLFIIFNYQVAIFLYQYFRRPHLQKREEDHEKILRHFISIIIF